MLRLVFTSDGVRVGVIIRSTGRFDLGKTNECSVSAYKSYDATI